MHRPRSRFSSAFQFLATVCLVAGAAAAQTANSAEGTAGGYSGVFLEVPGIYLTPIPNVPFSATEHLVTHQKTADGADRVLQTTTHIARSSSGMTYTERRRLLPAAATAEPALLEGQIYDPASHRRTLYNPFARIARQTTLSRARPLKPGPTAPNPNPRPGLAESDLGAQTFEGLELHGLRRVRTIPAAASGTGAEIKITDDYWYSADLGVYVIIRHDDPRSGEQMIALSEIARIEPDSTRFRVPDSYKIVDETPDPAPPPSANGSGPAAVRSR
jgi:hypothetical protein